MTPTPFPAELAIALDASTREVEPGTLVGGSPRRMVRLSTVGRAAFSELRAGRARSAAAGVLARRLTDVGLAHPRPAGPDLLDVTVVVPAHGRPDLLAGCLAALGDRHPVVVVDDASPDEQSIAAVAAEHGATVIRRDCNGGPAAARNTGLARVSTEFVAFVDSDCLPDEGWIEALGGHFRDPLVAAIAPRIVAADSSGRYVESVSLLDLGDRESCARAGGPVGYVPTAALVVRTAALASLGHAFDERLRYGEDVDLVWRLNAAGWRVRYDPAVEVGHREPTSWRQRWRKRFHYGTSAAPLAVRHPGSVPPMVVSPLSLVAAAGLLARRPGLAAAGLVGSTAVTARTLRRAGLPAAAVTAPPLALRATASTWVATGRVAGQFGLPVVLTALARLPKESTGSVWSRRLAVAALISAGPLAAHRRSGSPLSAGRFVVGQLLDDIAYGAGVIAGCIHHRTADPLRPVRSMTTEVV